MADVHPSFQLPADLPATLPVMALRRGVLLPGVGSPFIVGRARSVSALSANHKGYLIVAAQREGLVDPDPADLLPTAVIARVVERQRAPNGDAERVVVQGIARVTLTGFTATQPHLEARYRVVEEVWPDDTAARGMRDAFRAEVERSADLIGGRANVNTVLTFPPQVLVDAIAGSLTLAEAEWHKEILSTHDPMGRAERVLVELVKAREAIAARDTIQERVQNATRDQQRDFILRQQLKAIQEELGEGSDDDLARLKDRLTDRDLPDEVQEVVDREIKRLERLSTQSPERSVAVDWLEWIADMPWGRNSAVGLDLEALEAALDHSHHGLADVKRQVVEHLAVQKLAGSGRADVLLLVGPPGVGKTSIGQAIADVTGRKLVRVALGGVRDESELRGHRRTYIGARPGRLIEGIRRAGTADPVVLLDEIDKLGTGTWGDPASALLEILDPEQNHHFVDRYLEVPFDLSKVLFVATANDLGNVPGPLRDRMQLIDIPGYGQEDKLTIARNHLLQTVAKNAGIDPTAVAFTDAALQGAIAGWTREAGVRELQRVLGKVFRAAAVLEARGQLKPPLTVDAADLPTYLGKRRFFDEEPEVNKRPGIARGLAWTPVGGTVLYVEASTLPGNGHLVLTGQLGDVMKESARAALTYVLANAEKLGIPLDVLHDKDVHIHVPAGGVPKDGPSAGVTMFTTIASLLSGRAVRDDVAMTGEATLRGRVLPVGGIQSKVLAAHRHGLKTLILPKRNELDLDDLPAAVRADLDIHLVEHMDEVLSIALVPVAEVGQVKAA
ncbi:MAG: endopeptidase La [Myxococcota bacterium]